MYFTISLSSPLERCEGPSFEQIWFSLTQGCFVPTFVEIDSVVVEKKKIWKVYDDNNDYGNDDDQDNEQRTNCDQKNSLEPSAQMS